MGKPLRSMLSARFSPMTARPTRPICDFAIVPFLCRSVYVSATQKYKQLPLDPRAATLDHVLDFVQRHHRGVAAGRLRQRAMRRAVLDRALGALAREQAVDDAARE